MADSITRKQHDIYPMIQCYLKNDDLTPVDLTGVTRVNFLARPTGVATNVVKAQATIITAASSFVGYLPTYSDATQIIVWDQEWEIMRTASGPQTVPNNSMNTIAWIDDLDI